VKGRTAAAATRRSGGARRRPGRHPHAAAPRERATGAGEGEEGAADPPRRIWRCGDGGLGEEVVGTGEGEEGAAGAGEGGAGAAGTEGDASGGRLGLWVRRPRAYIRAAVSYGGLGRSSGLTGPIWLCRAFGFAAHDKHSLPCARCPWRTSKFFHLSLFQPHN
jgi:hypothetical protein